jgi:hypothetical protein
MTRYWFKPKRYGYGATPATWEGWAFTGLIVAIVAVAASLLFKSGHAPGGTMVLVWWAFLAIVVALTVVVAKFKTDGALAVAVGTRFIGPRDAATELNRCCDMPEQKALGAAG